MVENLKLRQFKIAIRDLKNKATGQQKLIDEYNAIAHKIAVASDKEPTKTARKAQLQEAFRILDETTYKTTDSGFEMDGFNPYTASKSVVKAKVELGRKLLNNLGLER
ncbi:MAG: hypothetical protein KBS86_02190 [Proteobacteria bacterium]|nr:hypothetical protein [Candidatus Enterousia scatequi]